MIHLAVLQDHDHLALISKLWTFTSYFAYNHHNWWDGFKWSLNFYS